MIRTVEQIEFEIRACDVKIKALSTKLPPFHPFSMWAHIDREEARRERKSLLNELTQVTTHINQFTLNPIYNHG